MIVSGSGNIQRYNGVSMNVPLVGSSSSNIAPDLSVRNNLVNAPSSKKGQTPVKDVPLLKGVFGVEFICTR